MLTNKSGLFLAGAHKKARTPNTEPEGVWGKINSKKAVSRTQIQAIDLISEGEIDGLVSGSFYYSGVTGEYGYISGRFEPFGAFNANSSDGNSDVTVDSSDDIRWLRSIYWNNIPLADSSDQLNYPNIDVAFVKGTANGVVQDNETSFSRQITRRATETRAISERLRGPNVNYASIGKGSADPSENFYDLYDPSNPTSANHKRAIVNAKRYRILNKNCTEVQVNIKVANLQYRELRNSKKLGDALDSTVSYFIQVEPIFHKDSPVPREIRNAFIRVKNETVKGRITSGFINTSAIPLPNMSSRDDFLAWDVVIIRTTPDSLDSRKENTTFVDSITEVYQDEYSYPHSAIVSTKFSAELFSDIPSRQFDMKLIKVKVPSNYNPLLRNYGQISGGARYYADKGLKPNAGRPFARTSSNLVVTQGTEHTTTDVPAEEYVWQDQGSYEDYFTTPGQIVQNIGGLSEVELGDPTVNGTTDIWDGNFKPEKQWTDNPAWVFYDLLTNKRYGIGKYINEEDIDKWTLYKVGQYCDQLVPDGEGGLEPRFSANVYLNKREEAFDVINDMSSIFRGIAYYGQGSIFVAQDILKDPLYLFNNSNVVNGDFTYSTSNKKTRHNVIVVRYLDSDNLYQPAIEYVKDVESIKKYGERELEVTAFGATTKSQALRWGRWTLFTENLQTETVSFAAGLEASYLKPGDVFKIQDSNRSEYKFGGRVSGIRIDDDLGAKITLDRYVDFAGLKDADGADMGTGVLSVLAPTYYYESINTNITDSQYVDEIRTKQFFQYNIFTGLSLNTDADGYVSKQIAPSGEYVNGLTEITLTGSTYQAHNINLATRDLDLNSENYSEIPFTYVINDYHNLETRSNLYTLLSCKETEFNKYQILGLQYVTGKYGLIEEDFSLAEFSPHLSDDPPKKPILYVEKDADDLSKIRYKLSVAEKDGFPDPEHNTSMLYLYMFYEATPDEVADGESTNAFLRKAEFDPANPATNDSYRTYSFSTTTVDGSNTFMEGFINGAKAPGRYSFVAFSMNYKGDFSVPNAESYSQVTVTSEGLGEMNDIIVYGLSTDEESSPYSNGFGQNTNSVALEETIFDVTWQFSTTSEASFEQEYGYLISEDQRQGRGVYAGGQSYSSSAALPTSTQLKTLITIRAVADTFSAEGVGTPSSNVYNFKNFNNVENLKEFSKLKSDCVNADKYILNTFTQQGSANQNGLTVFLTDRNLNMNISRLAEFETLNTNYVNYLYEYGPPREFDIVVEVINSETKDPDNGRIPSSASVNGLGNYTVTDLDADAGGINLGFDRLTVKNPRLPTFYFIKGGESEPNASSIPEYDNSVGHYANADLNGIGTDGAYVKVTNGNTVKLYLLLQKYSDQQRDPATSDGLGYWIEINSIAIATIQRTSRTKLTITPKSKIYVQNGQLRKEATKGFADEIFNDFENGGFFAVSANVATRTNNGIGEDIFNRSIVYNLPNSSNNNKFEVDKIYSQRTAIKALPNISQKVIFSMDQFVIGDEVDDYDEDQLAAFYESYTLDLGGDVGSFEYFMIGSKDKFDTGVITKYGEDSQKTVEYMRKAVPYSNVINLPN